MDRQAKLDAFGRLLDIMDDLRAKCPWDMKQNFETLRTLTIEETYELSDAIMSNNLVDIKEEIGDLMLHMVFYAKLGEETGTFDVATVLHGICDKLVKRHPHIYGNIRVENEADVKKNWEQIKLAEGKKSVLAGVPNSLPSLVKAYRMQEKTAQIGFEWEKIDDVWAKVEEELGELKEAIANNDQVQAENEFGDVIFSMVNYARFIGVNPDTALEVTNKKFKNRFEYIESKTTKKLSDMSINEMDALWNEAKHKGL
ncbi:MAG: nucleoside triphosphate pyrophosphohydrolase [Saprospiraceae bacterium]|jgi:XTP/dITP diphosphohydrolase